MADLVQDPQQPPAERTARRNWLGWGLVILILTVLALTLDLAEIIATLAGVKPLELTAVLLLMTLDRLIMAWKWSILLHAVGVKLPLTTIVRFYYQGTLSGVVLPNQVGGDVLRAYWVSEATGITHPVFASIVMEKIIGLLAAVTWAIVGAILLASLVYPAGLWSWVMLGVATIVFGNGAFILSMRPTVHETVLRGLRRWENTKILGLFHRFYQSYARLTEAPGAIAANALVTVGEQALQIGLVFLLAHSLGIEAGTVAFLAVAAIHLMIYRIPITPDNWGVGELTAIGLFGMIGIKPEATFSFMLASRIVQVITVLPGLLFLLQPSRPSARRPLVTDRRREPLPPEGILRPQGGGDHIH